MSEEWCAHCMQPYAVCGCSRTYNQSLVDQNDKMKAALIYFIGQAGCEGCPVHEPCRGGSWPTCLQRSHECLRRMTRFFVDGYGRKGSAPPPKCPKCGARAMLRSYAGDWMCPECDNPNPQTTAGKRDEP